MIKLDRDVVFRVLSFALGILVLGGWISQNQADQATGALIESYDMIAGAILILASVIGSLRKSYTDRN